MNNTNTFLAGAVVGAGIMYLLDPDRGRRRRALVKDRVEHGRHVLGDAADRAEAHAEDLRNRAEGAVHEARSRAEDEQVDDATLEARVRSAMGRSVANPGAIKVTAYNGRLTLTGQVLAREVEELLAEIRKVRGVDRIDNFLEVHTSPEGISSLQGAREE